MDLLTMPVPLLFQQIVPVDDAQATLTRMCLTDISESLMTYFLALRAETDAVLAPLLPSAGGKPYPYGRCEEITRELHARLVKRLERPTCAVERTIREFVGKGGAFRSVWGWCPKLGVYGGLRQIGRMRYRLRK
jgi:hypothetical protein